MNTEKTFEIVINHQDRKHCVVYNPTNTDIKCYSKPSWAEKRLKELNQDWKTIHKNNFRIKHNTDRFIVEQKQKRLNSKNEYQYEVWIYISESIKIDLAMKIALDKIKEIQNDQQL